MNLYCHGCFEVKICVPVREFVNGVGIIKGLLFAHHVSQHLSTKYSPFFLICNRDPVLPIDVKFSLVEREVNETEVFDEETCETILASATRILREIHESATTNIKKTQDKHKKDFDLHHLFKNEIKVGGRSYLIT